MLRIKIPDGFFEGSAKEADRLQRLRPSYYNNDGSVKTKCIGGGKKTKDPIENEVSVYY